MRRLNSILLLLGLCALTQTQALRVFARTALPTSQELDDEEPEPQGRLFSIIRETEPARYPLYDPKPIIISQPPQASYPPLPYYQSPVPAPPPPPPPAPAPAPYPVPQPIPFPVPVPPPIPPTIIRPIISRPHHHHNPGFGGFGGFPPFINITYSPVVPATRSGLLNRGVEEAQLNDLNQLSQLLFPQGQPQFMPQQLSQLQQLQQFQQLQQLSQLQNQALPTNVAYPPFNGNVNNNANNQEGTITLAQFQQLLSNYVPSQQLIDIDMNAEPDQRIKMRRSQKSKRKSKKSKKSRVHPQTVYLAIDPVQGQLPIDVQAQAQAQANAVQA
ncbi:YLP motif-containing protein 1-like [Drosophila nasuta]|uniref:YLP motif-containing protein 1-like n=1 Tax=Drosophila nasuta TaxID=42062 RepID=UPI00295E7748|nr:YLP motif-containing protein 1-like [Drosophila nasuta]